MNKDELKELALRLNDDRVHGMRKNLHERLIAASGGARLSRRTVDGWFIGRTIERYWEAALERLDKGKLILTRDECAIIQKWFGHVPSSELTAEDLVLVKKLNP
jgi:hypothetical protein